MLSIFFGSLVNSNSELEVPKLLQFGVNVEIQIIRITYLWVQARKIKSGYDILDMALEDKVEFTSEK